MIPLPAQILFPKIDFQRARPMPDCDKMTDSELGQCILSHAKAQDRYLTYDEFVVVQMRPLKLFKYALPERLQFYAAYRRAYELKRVGFWGRAFGFAWHAALVIAFAVILAVIAVTAAVQAIAAR